MSKKFPRILPLVIVAIFLSLTPESMSAATCECYCNNGKTWDHIGWAWTPNGCTWYCDSKEYGINKGCGCWGPEKTDCWNGWGSPCDPNKLPSTEHEKQKSQPLHGKQLKEEMKKQDRLKHKK